MCPIATTTPEDLIPLAAEEAGLAGACDSAKHWRHLRDRVRIISSNNLQINHLVKQQVIGYERPGTGAFQKITLGINPGHGTYDACMARALQKNDPRGIPPAVAEAEISSRGSTNFKVITARRQQVVVTVMPKGGNSILGRRKFLRHAHVQGINQGGILDLLSNNPIFIMLQLSIAAPPAPKRQLTE